MADIDKLWIRRLDGTSDYSLWRFRVRAEIVSRDLDKVFGTIRSEDIARQ